MTNVAASKAPNSRNICNCGNSESERPDFDYELVRHYITPARQNSNTPGVPEKLCRQIDTVKQIIMGKQQNVLSY
jgi:hypothetical protein